MHLPMSTGVYSLENNASDTFVGGIDWTNSGLFEDHLYLGNSYSNLVLMSSLLDSESAALHLNLHTAWDYQDDGSMLVNYIDAAHNFRTALLTPVPEPGSLAVLALGAVGLMRRRR